MATDPAAKIKRQQTQLAVEQAGVTPRAIQASLKKTTREPKAIEIGYQGFLVSVQRLINKEIRKALPSMNATLDMARVNITDAMWDRKDVTEPMQRMDTLSDDIVTAFNSLKATILRLSTATAGTLTIGVQDTAAKTADFNDAKYDDPLMRLIGIGNVSADIEANILAGWVTENVQLVGNMNAQQVGKLETLYLRALRDGSRSSQVVGETAAILGSSVDRARLIARDQVGKLDGQLSRQKQTEAGVKAYVRRGALDGRERPSHVRREGVRFLWSQPPPDGHPGQPIQCRCGPEPDLSFLGAEFAPEPRSEADFSQATPEARAETRRQQAKRRARRRPRNRAPGASS